MSTQHKPINIAVAGLGLLGGSLGLALADTGVNRIGWARRANTRSAALEIGAVDETFPELEQVLSVADIVVLALPVPVIIEYLPLCAEFGKKGAVITDIGSIKSEIITAAEKVFTSPDGPDFIGSHPMAGTEKSGISAAFSTLYRNADVFITPTPPAPECAIASLEKMWQSISCNTSRINARAHDRLVAETSHALHVVASALTLSILDNSDEEEKLSRFRGCATGFKDTSRIASSNPQMWREIVEHNTPAVLEALELFEQSLGKFKQLLKDKDYDGFEENFTKGKALRDSWLKYKDY